MIEVCERNVSAKYQREGWSHFFGGRAGRRAYHSDGACVDLSCDETRERLTSRSLVINTLGGATDSVHRQSSRHPSCAWKIVFSFLTGGMCVFLKLVTSQVSKIELDPSMDRQP